MMPATASTIDANEARQLRAGGATIETLARLFDCHRGTMAKICFGIVPLKKNDKQSRRLSEAWKSQSIQSPEQLADLADVPLETARRFLEARRLKDLFRELEAEELAEESVDNGQRIPAVWMRRWCSRWERSVGQCRALWGKGLTLIEVYRSAVDAGLSLRPYLSELIIGDTNNESRQPRQWGEHEPRVYKLAIGHQGE